MATLVNYTCKSFIKLTPGGLTSECWRPQPVGLGSEGIPALTENFEIVKLGNAAFIGEVFIYFLLEIGGGGGGRSSPLILPSLSNL